jgi:putative tricarboxylic transport membrane protein
VVNPELVIAFGLFTAMMFANILNWTIGGQFMRWVGVMSKVPKPVLMPMVFLLTITAVYVQETSMTAVYFLLGFGFLGYLIRKIKMPILPFVIAFILAGNLETAMRQGFAVSGADPLFLFRSPLSLVFLVLSVVVVIFFSRKQKADPAMSSEVS